jgi:hypothetical protein
MWHEHGNMPQTVRYSVAAAVSGCDDGCAVLCVAMLLLGVLHEHARAGH